jgi:hypothetical protein
MPQVKIRSFDFVRSSLTGIDEFKYRPDSGANFVVERLIGALFGFYATTISSVTGSFSCVLIDDLFSLALAEN